MQNVAYHFRLANGHSASCLVGDDAGDEPVDLPAWTELEFEQCPNCPLLPDSSACPRTDFLRSMAHFHLPFASEEETIYRAASTYLLGQYFFARNGGVPDWELDGLKARYLALQSVNAAMARRLRQAVDEDGAINALIILDLLAKALPYSIDDKLDDIKAAFLDG